MPVQIKSDFHPRWYLCNAHLQTLYPTIYRQLELTPYVRERIDTPDGDFLDLDWIRCGRSRLVVLLHGLEGSSRRVYMRGMAKTFLDEGWDVLSLNFRSCSGEPNQ